MSNEIRAVSAAGRTLYAHLMNASAQRWNGSSFETYAAGSWSTYDIALTEQGSSGVYLANFPSAITAAGTYEYFVYLQAGGSPAESDRVINTGSVVWNGSTTVSAATGAMSGSEFYDYVIRTFIRTDKSTQVYEAITDTVAELRRLLQEDGAETQVTSTDTISTLGDYKINLESNHGFMIGDPVIIEGESSYPLTKISKLEFDAIYPNPDSASVNKSKPIYYCIFAGQIWLGPVPDSTSYTYKLSYSKVGGTINSSTTTVPYTDKYREAVKHGTLWRLFIDLEGAEKEAVTYGALYENDKAAIEAHLAKNKQPTCITYYNDL